ncbi:MAG: hypothetical protein Q7K43_01525, partial [Candidatus Woesearchaeota archaeon]|nr:hypothetical protein [Candidatus Woesearchaeota archaeon]
ADGQAQIPKGTDLSALFDNSTGKPTQLARFIEVAHVNTEGKRDILATSVGSGVESITTTTPSISTLEIIAPEATATTTPLPIPGVATPTETQTFTPAIPFAFRQPLNTAKQPIPTAPQSVEQRGQQPPQQTQPTEQLGTPIAITQATPTTTVTVAVQPAAQTVAQESAENQQPEASTAELENLFNNQLLTADVLDPDIIIGELAKHATLNNESRRIYQETIEFVKKKAQAIQEENPGIPEIKARNRALSDMMHRGNQSNGT